GDGSADTCSRDLYTHTHPRKHTHECYSHTHTHTQVLVTHTLTHTRVLYSQTQVLLKLTHKGSNIKSFRFTPAVGRCEIQRKTLHSSGVCVCVLTTFVPNIS